MADSDGFVRIRNLNKTYPGAAAPVLRSVNIDMSRNDRVVIIGPSGGGKSTLLRCVMGLEEVDSGSIELAGKTYVERSSDGRRTRFDAGTRNKVGMVFQSYTLFPHMNVLQNLTLAPVKARGVPRAEARARAGELLRRFGLSEKLSAYPSQLSGGQKQRVAIARALMLDPSLMLFDEVTSALDPELVVEVESMILDLATNGMPMMIVTHDMWFARNIATRVIFCADGTIQEDAPAKQFFSSPSNARTRDFLDTVLHARATLDA